MRRASSLDACALTVCDLNPDQNAKNTSFTSRSFGEAEPLLHMDAEASDADSAAAVNSREAASARNSGEGGDEENDDVEAQLSNSATYRGLSPLMTQRHQQKRMAALRQILFASARARLFCAT